MKSTNVRVDSAAAPEERPSRALALALAAWAAAVALGAHDAVFERLGARVDGVLALLATIFALAVYGLDPAVRRWIDALPTLGIAVCALAGDIALAATLTREAGVALFAGPSAIVTLFAAPLALAAHLPLARASARRRLSSAAARPPAARRAAS